MPRQESSHWVNTFNSSSARAETRLKLRRGGGRQQRLCFHKNTDKGDASSDSDFEQRRPQPNTNRWALGRGARGQMRLKIDSTGGDKALPSPRRNVFAVDSDSSATEAGLPPSSARLPNDDSNDDSDEDVKAVHPGASAQKHSAMVLLSSSDSDQDCIPIKTPSRLAHPELTATSTEKKRRLQRGSERKEELDMQQRQTRRQQAAEKLRALKKRRVGSDDEDGGEDFSDASMDSLDGFIASTDGEGDADLPPPMRLSDFDATPSASRAKFERGKRRRLSSDNELDDAEDWQHLMPAQFSTASLADAFPIIIQSLASELLQPGFLAEVLSNSPSGDQYFKLAWSRAWRHMNGLATTLQSEAWTPEFKNALKIYPEMHSVPCRVTMDDCEACGRKGHPSSILLTFSGPSYDPRTLQISSDDTDELSRKEYRVGRFCADRSASFHGMTHVAHLLAAAIATWMDAEGVVIQHPLFSDHEEDDDGGEAAAEAVVRVMKDDKLMKRLWTLWQSTVEKGTGWVSGHQQNDA